LGQARAILMPHAPLHDEEQYSVISNQWSVIK
jgi:hypothetical protein